VLDEIDDTMEFIPFGLVDDIFELNGAFEYGRRGRGLRFCEDALYDDDDKSCPPVSAYIMLYTTLAPLNKRTMK
jgi:hypothetical protein